MESSETPDTLRSPFQDAVEGAVWRAIESITRRDIFVAFSGGLDSRVLLETCARLRARESFRLHALHVDHGWFKDSAQWERRCREMAESLKVAFTSTRLDAENASSARSEAVARAARYAWFARTVPPDAVLLTAHHADDQAETVMLRLLRGASVNGLGAMRQTQQMDGITVLRPMLTVPRASIRTYATVRELNWIEDPSNEDTRYDRNFLRHQVMPLLESRWPQLQSGLVAAAGSFQSAQEVLDELAEQDLQDAALGTHPCRLGVLGALNQDTVLSLSDGRRKNLLRYWIRTRCHTRPSEKSLREFIKQIGSARGDGMLSLKGDRGFFSLRTYRRGLFIIPESASASQNRTDTRLWDGETVRLDEVDIRLRCERGRGVGLRLDLLDRAPLELRWTHGQARVAPSEAGPHRRRLRVLLQEQGVPPWERARIPMVFSEGEFICMPGVITAREYLAGPSVSGARIVLEDLRVRQSAAGSGVSS